MNTRLHTPSAAAAPVAPIWTTGSTELIQTGTWRASLPRHVQASAPCHGACPVGGDIAEWIGLARARDFEGAWQVLTRHNPFPAIAGRICHHPCESACNRAGYDEALSICKLERFIGDQALHQRWRFPTPPAALRGNVGIVGGGPSGLSAAFQLRRMGFAVTVYEAQAQLGGVMRYGIPTYRLGREVLEGEIERILALGITVECNTRLDDAPALERLRARHGAVYLACGAGRSKRLAQVDYSRAWACDGARFLAAANAGEPLRLGQRVVVVGGGSAALDAARSARRLGHTVTVLALESRAQMPAQHEEVQEALEEGVTLVCGARLERVLEQGAEGLSLQCVRVQFVPGATRGAFTVQALAESGFALQADAVLTSIGQDPDLNGLAQELSRQGALVWTDAHGATSLDGVYAGGDMASMARFVTEAVGMGKRAAWAMAQALAPEGLGAAPHPAAVPRYDAGQAPVPLAAIATHYRPHAPRVPARVLDVSERLVRGDEVQLGLELEQALAESERCFSCGTCIRCDNCVVYCPDMAVKRVEQGYSVLTDYCKGCGMCVKECPTGSMVLQEEVR
ncbi:MAG: FAD-dependent oxidoreductase [Rhodoferax sp.]